MFIQEQYGEPVLLYFRAYLEYIFTKMLVDSNRLRIRFPQYRNTVTLDFSLQGSKQAILTAVDGCESKAPNPLAEKVPDWYSNHMRDTWIQERRIVTRRFRDGYGNLYASFADMLRDDTWKARQ